MTARKLLQLGWTALHLTVASQGLGPVSFPGDEVTAPVPVSAPVPVQPKAAFFFVANETPPTDVADAIAEFYGETILVADSIQGKTVTGRVFGLTLDETLSAFSFLLGTKYRLDRVGGSWLVGGDAIKVVTLLPSYGLSAADVASISKDGARLVGGQIVLEADEGRTKEIKAVIEGFKVRPSILLELYLLDLSSGSVDRVNEWLDQVKIAAGYVAKAGFAVAAPAPGRIAATSLLRSSGPVYDVQLGGLLQLIERDRTAKIELRQQMQVMSGSETLFTSGEIVEQPVILREPETGKDLVSRYERRTVGLQVKLKAVALPEGWSLRVDLEDSNFVSQRERSTKIVTERMLKTGAGMTLLASFSRTTTESLHRGVPVLGNLGKIGKKLFQTTQDTKGSRSLMLLVREVAGH